MNDLNKLELNADIAVIGGGAAGLAAAVSAAENGAGNVILLEALHAIGGNGLYPGGFFSAENQAGPPGGRQQTEMTLDERLDMFFNRHMNYCQWYINPRLVRVLINRSGETHRWLKNLGCSFEGAGAVVKTLIKKCSDLNIKIVTDTRASHLIINNKGKITGVTAESKDKKLIVTAGSVIIATGGMAGNRKLLEQYMPGLHEGDFIFLGGLPHQGDGLKMALEAGVDTDGLIMPEMTGPMCPWLNLSQEVTVNPKTIWINRKGQRFTKEIGKRFEAAHAVFRQPGKEVFCIMDENTINTMLQSNNLPGRPQVSSAESAAYAEKVKQEFKSQIEKGNVKISNAWEEIAAFIGITPEILKATVDEYNSSCDKKHDDLFAKEPNDLVALRKPPYYAVRCCIRLLVTHGGIKINHKMEAVNKEYDQIPGLYAAGVETGGSDWVTYDDGLPAHSFSFSVIEGRIAGENAAKYTRGH
jgi:fumarate reductase flavoprotein subunit